MERKVFTKFNNKEEDYIINSDSLMKYYSDYYPKKLILDWLTKKNLINLKYREFGFTGKDNHLKRYQSFKSLDEFKKRIEFLNPIKIDIGGVYNKEPRNYKKEEIICKERELVFDIDINNYDEVRKCCQKNDICSICWKYIVCGAKILERILTEDFGFKKIFYVFSGRRGIHCWVCDKRACVLNNIARTAIEKYIYFRSEIDKLKDINIKKSKRNFADPVHPSYLSAVSLIKNSFYEILKEQNFFEDIKFKNILKNIITLYFEAIDIDVIDYYLNAGHNSVEKLNKIKEYLSRGQKIINNNFNSDYFSVDACINEFIMFIVYPRLDSNVTIQLNHLLKGPFSVHPTTGYISIPMSIELLEKLNLDKIPKVDYLIESKNKKENEIFSQYIKFFENFVKNINENE